MLGKVLGFYVVALLTGGGWIEGTAPTISGLSYSPSSIAKGSGDWARTIYGKLDFANPEGDAISLTVSGNGDSADSTFSVAGTDGVTAGSLVIYVMASTATAQVAPFDLWVSGSDGLNSNMLSGSLSINASASTRNGREMIGSNNSRNVEWKIVSVELVSE